MKQIYNDENYAIFDNGEIRYHHNGLIEQHAGIAFLAKENQLMRETLENTKTIFIELQKLYL